MWSILDRGSLTTLNIWYLGCVYLLRNSDLLAGIFCAITKYNENQTQFGCIYSSLWTHRPRYIYTYFGDNYQKQKNYINWFSVKKREKKNPIPVFTEKFGYGVKKQKRNCYKNCKKNLFLLVSFLLFKENQTKQIYCKKLRLE